MRPWPCAVRYHAMRKEGALRLYITRHGQTVWNLEHRYQGQGDSPLTEEGERQAARLAGRLTAVPLDAVYSSDQRRAWRTAQVVTSGRALDVVQDPAWRERAYGDWEGMTRPDIAARFPDQWRAHAEDRAGSKPPGGENLREVQQRVVTALAALRERHAGQQVLVVTHGGTLWVLACTLHGDDLATSQRPYLANCGLSVLQWTAGGVSIECWDDVAHLSGDVSDRG